jgi:hypothetical protein|uniref:Uncharacterized protein n=1 Tax=Fagus sylvatica TaxID=28930 RepID=A0A2N9FQW5_FAGSY
MEAVLVPYSSPDQSISPYNNKYKQQIRTPSKKSSRAFLSKPSESLSPTIIHGGLLHHYPPPTFRSFSYPPSYQQQQQPPLLPLPNPMAMTQHHSLPSRTPRKPNRPRDQSLTPKKSKTTKREDPKQDLKTKTHAISECLIIASTKRLGPDPNDLPKDVCGFLSSSSSKVVVGAEEFEKFSGAVFSLAPPPSSLPLPKFSLRPKLSCKVEASAGIDAGATDNLRRLLRLH